jgi:hypothetical protein
MAHPDQDHPPGDLRAAASREGSFLQTVKAVAWSFFGVRKSSDHEADIAKLNPVHVILVGVLAAVVFVVVMVSLAHWVVRSGIAT